MSYFTPDAVWNLFAARMETRTGKVAVFDGNLVSRLAAYLDVDRARAAAELLAEERG